MQSVAVDYGVLTPKEEVSMRPMSMLKEGGARQFYKTKSTTNDGGAGAGTSGHRDAGGAAHQRTRPTAGATVRSEGGQASSARARAWKSRWGRAKLGQRGGRQRVAQGWDMGLGSTMRGVGGVGPGSAVRGVWGTGAHAWPAMGRE
jgi:hypothetical protein